MAPEVKLAKHSKLPKLPENYFEPVGKGGWPPISTWIDPPSLGSNGTHCIEFLHEMRKLLLNLVPGEPLALVKELAYFDNSIQLDIILVSVLDLCVHDLISCSFFHAIYRFSSVGVSCSTMSDVSNNGGKYG